MYHKSINIFSLDCNFLMLYSCSRSTAAFWLVHHNTKAPICMTCFCFVTNIFLSLVRHAKRKRSCSKHYLKWVFTIWFSFLQDGSLDRLSSKDFVVLARIVERFALDCEEVSGRQSHNLRGTLLTQAKRFIERFHDERKHKLRFVICHDMYMYSLIDAKVIQLIFLSLFKFFSPVKMFSNGGPVSFAKHLQDVIIITLFSSAVRCYYKLGLYFHSGTLAKEPWRR